MLIARNLNVACGDKSILRGLSLAIQVMPAKFEGRGRDARPTAEALVAMPGVSCAKYCVDTLPASDRWAHIADYGALAATRQAWQSL